MKLIWHKLYTYVNWVINSTVQELCKNQTYISFWFRLEPRNDKELQDENNNGPPKKPLTNKPSFKLTADNPHHLPVKGKSLNSRIIKTTLFWEIFLCFLKL